MKKNNYQSAVSNLIHDEKPSEWVSWLFDVQSNLIGYGHFDGMDIKGASDTSARFWQLKNFFEDIGKLKK